jgi:hypothetical protein
MGGKTATALQIVPLPQFVATQLRARHHADDDPACIDGEQKAV